MRKMPLINPANPMYINPTIESSFMPEIMKSIKIPIPIIAEIFVSRLQVSMICGSVGSFIFSFVKAL